MIHFFQPVNMILSRVRLLWHGYFNNGFFSISLFIYQLDNSLRFWRIAELY